MGEEVPRRHRVGRANPPRPPRPVLRADAERLAQAEARAKEEMDDVERRRREMEASDRLAAGGAPGGAGGAGAPRRAAPRARGPVAADAEGLAAKAQRLEVQRTQQREARDELREERENVAQELERVAGLTVADAKREVIAEAERQAKLTATQLARTIETTAKRDADRTLAASSSPPSSGWPRAQASPWSARCTCPATR